MDERYKDFPPGWGHLKVPTSSRRAALACLALYAPCRPRGIWAQRAAWWTVSSVGPRALPGRGRPWRPPVDPEPWDELLERWRAEIGPFDGIGAYERVQAHRPGLILLLLDRGCPVAFVKLHHGDGSALGNEVSAIRALSKHGVGSFRVPAPITLGEVGGWHYSAVEPLPPRPHRAVEHPPLALIVREIGDALAARPRPAGAPTHWQPMHGDLTPWNLRRLADGRTVLFDWEEAGWGPPGADAVLYRATAAALRGERAGPRDDEEEAVAFWLARLAKRPAVSRRDRTLALSLESALERMRPTHRRAAGTPAPERRPRVLVFAYACEPDRGSEPGAGWGLVRALSEIADCTVLVGPEHTPALHAWKAAHPSAETEFVEVPEPRVAPYAKWHRIPWFLLYLAWARRAHRVGRDLHARHPFDATFHATYATYWLPSPSTRFGVPCLWGPVGGGATTPLRLWGALGWRGAVDEVIDLVSVRAAARWRSTRRTWRDASARIVQNEETLARLPAGLRERTRVLNHVMFVEVPKVGSRERSPHALWLSALEARKGPRLALRALAHAPEEVRLRIAGDGPERRALERLARRLGVAHRVDFLGRVPHARVFDLLAEAACVVFTNLREEGGVALAEAMLSGAPVVVLANGGTRDIAASTTDPRRVALVEPAGLSETARRIAEAMTRFIREPPAAGGPMLDQSSARLALRAIFHEALASPSARRAPSS